MLDSSVFTPCEQVWSGVKQIWLSVVCLVKTIEIYRIKQLLNPRNPKTIWFCVPNSDHSMHVQLCLTNVGSDYSTVYVHSDDLDCHTISSLPPPNVHSRVIGPPWTIHGAACCPSSCKLLPCHKCSLGSLWSKASLNSPLYVNVGSVPAISWPCLYVAHDTCSQTAYRCAKHHRFILPWKPSLKDSFIFTWYRQLGDPTVPGGFLPLPC